MSTSLYPHAGTSYNQNVVTVPAPYNPNRKTALLEKKRAQWAKERAAEGVDGAWDPFGKDRPVIRQRHSSVSSQRSAAPTTVHSQYQQPHQQQLQQSPCPVTQYMNRSNSSGHLNNPNLMQMPTSRGYPTSAYHQASPDSGIYTMPYPIPMTPHAQYQQQPQHFQQHPHQFQQQPILMQMQPNGMMTPQQPGSYYGTPPAPESYTEQWLELAQQPQHQQQQHQLQPLHFDDTRSSVSSGNHIRGTTPSRGRRRAVVNSAGRVETEQEYEQRIAKNEQTKAAIDEQIAIKERADAEADARNRHELARIEYERQCLEARAALEAEQELKKWKILEEEEQRRSDAILSALERARKEAAASRKAKLHRHVSQSGGERPTETHNVLESSSSPRYIANGSVLSSGNPDRPSSSELTDSDGKSASPTVPKSPTPQHDDATTISPLSTPRYVDERPLRPATKDPLLVWQEIEASLPPQPVESPLKRNTPSRSTLRARPRTTTASEPVKSRRATSGERAVKPQRLRSTQSNALGSTTDSDKAMERPTIVRPVSRAQRPTSKSRSPKRSKSPKRRTSKSPHRRRTKVEEKTDVVDTPKRPERLLSRRPTLDSMLNGMKTPKDEEKSNPWGDQLGGSNPLVQPITTRRRRKPQAPSAPTTPATDPQSPTDNEIDSILSNLSVSKPTTPSRPQSRASTRSAIPSTLNKTIDNGEAISGLLLAPTSVRRKEKDTSADDSDARATPVREFGFKRGPLYQSLSAKRRSTRLSTGDKPTTPSERQSEILSQLALLRQNLASKQRTMETTYSRSTAMINRYSNSNSSFTNRDAVL